MAQNVLIAVEGVQFLASGYFIVRFQ